MRGAAEVWRLEWKAQPKPFCMPDPKDDSWASCPCAGFTYGEIGNLDLVRIANGSEVDRFRLNSLFPEQYKHNSIIPRWPLRQTDFDNWFAYYDGGRDISRLVSEARKRPPVKVMNLVDYDHDGAATEFYIQTQVESCGHRNGVVVGLSNQNSKLHAFGTAAHPNKALHLEPREWEALQKSAAPPRMLDWNCGDHGRETQMELELLSTSAGLRKTSREFECTQKAQRGRLINTTVE